MAFAYSNSKIKYPNRFKKGQSGNAAGRPPTDLKIRQLAREHSLEAMNALVDVVTDSKASANTKMRAATVLLRTAWGKHKKFTELDNAEMTVSQYIERLQFKKMGMSDAFIDNYVRMQESKRNKFIVAARQEYLAENNPKEQVTDITDPEDLLAGL